MIKNISFAASIPDIQSAIKIGGDGMRVQFDVPESEMPNAIGLAGMRQKVLYINVSTETGTRCPVKPKREPGDKSLTPSQKLREVIWQKYWFSEELKTEYSSFEKYYELFMSELIEKVQIGTGA